FNANTVLQSAQTLLGGGGAIMLKGKDSGTQMQFTAPGAAATITGQALNYALTTASNVHVTGLGIDGTAGSGAILVAADVANSVTSNVVIDHNTIDAGGNDAIVTGSNGVNATTTNVRITDNVINSALNGINVFKTSELEISNNAMHNIDNAGIITQVAVTD